MGPDLYVAKEGATFMLDGQPVFITAGVTIVRAGHPVMRGRENLFQPLRVHYDLPAEPVETPRAAADTPKLSTTRADMQGARSRTKTE